MRHAPRSCAKSLHPFTFFFLPKTVVMPACSSVLFSECPYVNCGLPWGRGLRTPQGTHSCCASACNNVASNMTISRALCLRRRRTEGDRLLFCRSVVGLPHEWSIVSIDQTVFDSLPINRETPSPTRTHLDQEFFGHQGHRPHPNRCHHHLRIRRRRRCGPPYLCWGARIQMRSHCEGERVWIE